MKARRTSIRTYQLAGTPRRADDGRYLVTVGLRIDRSRCWLVEVVPFPDGPAKAMWPRACRWLARLAWESRADDIRAHAARGVGPTIADAVEHWRVQVAEGSRP